MLVSEKEFSDIVRVHSERLYRYVRRIVVSHDDAQDVLQETFLKAYRSILFLRNRESLQAWLYRIATNEANRFLSKKYHHQDLQQGLGRTLETEVWLDSSAKAELELEKALLGLTPLQRSVFYMRYYDEMDYVKMSDALGKSVDTLKVTYHNAKEKVKRYIEDNGL